MIKRRCVTIFIYGLALIGMVALCVGLEVFRVMNRPIPVLQNAAIIQVDKSTTATSLIQTMHAQGWISSVRFWTWWIRIQGLSSKLKAGIYQVQPDESAVHLLQRIVGGKVLRERFLIRPGSTMVQVSKDLAAAPHINYQDTDWTQLIHKYLSAEGLLLADTYVYDAGASGKEVIQQAHTHLNDVLNRAWEHRDTTLPYQTAYEALIVASILEREAAVPEERRLISGVVVNRLRRHMPLQMDPTVIYALGDLYQGSLSHAQMSVDSPYNTYRHQGLPPSPIAMVSADAIEAACHPSPNSYLYFVAKGDGTHLFTSTYMQHLEAIKRYMRKSV
ncbi:MAG: ABC transporter substrate-binding protein [Legionella sp.]|nr:MAG: ABC transporter substrate-binding protein [Legionella sp.]